MVEQVHREIVFHFPDRRERRYRPAFPFATFDYRPLCELLAARTDATFVRAMVDGYDAGRDLVCSSAGSFRGRVLIDASRWRAVLGSSLGLGIVERRALSLGLERRIDRREEAPRLGRPARRVAVGRPRIHGDASSRETPVAYGVLVCRRTSGCMPAAER